MVKKKGSKIPECIVCGWWLPAIIGWIVWGLVWVAKKVAHLCVVWWKKCWWSVIFVPVTVIVIALLVAIFCLLPGENVMVVHEDGAGVPEMDNIPAIVDVDGADIDIEVDSAGGDVDIDIDIANQATSPPQVEPKVEPQTEPPSPQIVGHISHEEMIYLLREIFPFAPQRGAEEQEFDITTRGDIERFLRTCPFPPTFNNQGDLMEFLRGNFYSWSQGENIPIGEVKVSDSEFFAITIVSEGSWQGQWMVLRINADGSLTAINSPDTREVFVVVH